MAQARRRILLWTLGGLLGVLAVSFVAGVLVGYLSGDRPGLAEGNAVVWVVGVVGVALMAAGIAVGTGWMRSIDEAAREAHKSAWYWGGSAGMALGGVGVILGALPQAANWVLPTLPLGRTDPVAYAAAGAYAMLVLMLAGYLIAWAIWWLRRR